MAKQRHKKCKGTGKAKGFGCGIELTFVIKNNIRSYNAVFGLGKQCGCYVNWLTSTKEGQKVLDKAKILGKNKVEIETRKKKREDRSLQKNWGKQLQITINSIVRTIDKGLPCLARNQKGQIHAGHVYPRGGNQIIKFNLHNIHRQSAQSNHYQNDDGKLREGVVNEYGQEYMDFISELRRTPSLQYNNKEYRSLTYKARKILKELKEQDRIYSKSERIEMRNRINVELGIYDLVYCRFEN